MSVPDLSIVVPTYREAANLTVLVPRIAETMAPAHLKWELIVVDDNSPDDTVEVCQRLAALFPVRLIVRTRERGLSSAVIAGMRAARGDILLCMDADLSHPPESIPSIAAALRDHDAVDFVIGSRYVEGGRTEDGWGLLRWINSRGATLLARPLTRTSDPMAGFFALRRDDFHAAEPTLNPVGYKIGLELLIKCACRNVAEVPILFTNRLHGESKLNLREQLNYLRHLARLYAFKFPACAQFLRFGIVGSSGVAVDLTAFAALLAMRVTLPVASVIAIWIAMTTNFCGNRIWTFAGSRRDSLSRQYVTFCWSCLLGGLLNWITRVLLWRSVPFFGDHELLAACAGVAAGTASNYALCRMYVFRTDGARSALPARASQSASDFDARPQHAAPLRRRQSAFARTLRLLGLCALLAVSGMGASPAPEIGSATSNTAAADTLEATAAGPALTAEAANENASERAETTPETAAPPAPIVRFDLSDTAIEQRLHDSAAYLASDDLEGRGIRTRGLDLAAEYLAREFAACGLRTDLYNGTPFHEFKLFSGATKGSVQELMLHDPDGQPHTLQPGEDFTSITLSLISPVALPAVFAGYGITAPEFGYDDYAGLDVAGKAVIVLRHEPQQSDPRSVFNGAENSDYAFLRPKIDNAVEHGAAFLILCTDAFSLQPVGEDPAPRPDELLRVELDESSIRESIPVAHCRRAVIEQWLNSSTGDSLAALETRIDETLQPQSRALGESHISGRVGLSKEGRTLRNVVASLEAEGPLARQTLIIGAHYDHLGRGGWGSLAIGANDEIHNGADDNASGTAVLLEIARQLASRSEPLRRRVLFIAFSAEELGLIGSAKYAQDPLVPLSDTVAMLNLDMVGRLRDGKLTVYGTGTAAEWPALIDHANAPLGLTIKRNSGGYGPSDHATFFERGIPVLHFFTGFHNQYHRPTDDADLLNVAGMRQIAGLVRDIAVELAQADKRPTSTGSQAAFDFAEFGDFDEEPELSIPDDRPLLGVALGPLQDGGIVVQRLIRNSAAEQHGIRAGDVLLAIDGKPAISSDAVIQALRDHPRESSLKVSLKRRGVELELDIPL